MKTIKEAEKEFYKNNILDDDNKEQLYKSTFVVGVEFAQQWISVEDELPDISENVNVRCKNKNKDGGIWLYDMTFIDEDTNTWNQKVRQNWETITHWRPIERI